MAKRPNQNSSQSPNSSLRVRWVEVEVNGSDTTIEEALHTVERMRRPVIDAPSTRKRIANASIPMNGENELRNDLPLFDNAMQVEAEVATIEPEPEPVGDTDAGSDAQRKKRGHGDPKDRNHGIKPVGDIDFVPNGKQSLKTFFSSKSPNSDMDQILVLCHFLQHTLQSTQIGPGHILGGLKHVGKPVPKDLKKTIRNMRDKKAWLSFTDIETIRLTTEGENRVEHDLGNGSSDAGA